MKYICFIIFLFFTSCKSFNDFTNQKVVPKSNGIQKMNFDGNQYTSIFKINGKEGDFLSDPRFKLVYLNQINNLIKQ